jgi:LacI family transcriptional regulator
MSVTIKQIAQRTGLSIPTVGNVLGRAASRYSADTRKKVLQAAEELGYRPNSSARAIRSGRFGCAALVLSRSRATTHSYIPPHLLDGLDDELGAHNMHLTVSRLTDEELSQTDFIPKVLREHLADGMIVNYTHEIPPPMLELIRSHRTPAVWLNAKLDGDCVYPDDFGAAKRATEELVKLGHKRIAFVHLIARFDWPGSIASKRPSFHYSVADRAAGYVSAMRAAGLPSQITAHDRFVNESEHLEVCRALLSGADRPTAVLAYSENEGQAVIGAALSLGISVPRDLSVLVFSAGEYYVAGHAVSVVAVPTEEMGRRAVRMLLEKLKKPDTLCPPQSVAYALGQGRGTVAPAMDARSSFNAV